MFLKHRKNTLQTNVLMPPIFMVDIVGDSTELGTGFLATSGFGFD